MSTQDPDFPTCLTTIILTIHAPTVGTILEDLSKRDSRFLFVKQSFDEFLDGKYGLREAEELREAIVLGRSEPDELRDPTQRSYTNFFDHDHQYLFIVFDDIVNTAIYELLNVFDLDITLEEA
ncbi:hypothetical protein F4679DRAFT_584814 [Xylaria curta]|nr:hypothetical protein F4679DRAFT_584814 [Xylaria curta]